MYNIYYIQIYHGSIILCSKYIIKDIVLVWQLLSRQPYQNVNRWFTTVINQPQVKSVIGNFQLCEKMAEFDAKKFAEIQGILLLLVVEAMYLFLEPLNFVCIATKNVGPNCFCLYYYTGKQPWSCSVGIVLSSHPGLPNRLCKNYSRGWARTVEVVPVL